MTDKAGESAPLSLLSAEASGGDTAEGGFSFQAGVILSKLPRWLAHDGFTSMIRESMGDFEACFFVPASGLRREFSESKNHSLTPTLFWKEIETFKRMDSESPETFQWFTLVSTGLSAELQPLVNGLRRVRDPFRFYDPLSGVQENSYSAYVERVEKLGRSKDTAKFLFERVLIEPSWSLAQDHATAIFRHQLGEQLPYFKECSLAALGNVEQALVALIKDRKNKPITRSEIEAAIDGAQAGGNAWRRESVRLHTSHDGTSGDRNALAVDWTRFFGGASRSYPPPQEWSHGLVRELTDLKRWIVEANRPRHVVFTGSRRLTASLAIGSVLSAVAGFTLEVASGPRTWKSDDHADAGTPPYGFSIEQPSRTGGRLVVSVSILRDTSDAVRTYAAANGMGDEPFLRVHSDQPVVSGAQANLAVRHLKNAITDALQTSRASRVDLFFSGPAQVALFLGHRLNATSKIQCYEWVTGSEYVPTCELMGVGA